MQPFLELAAVAVFAAHLLAVNLAMAGPILCIWLEWRDSRQGDPVARQLDRSLAGWSLAALAVGLVLGAALLGLLWLLGAAPYFAAVRMLPPDRLAFAASELVFSFVCMGVYFRLADRPLRRRWLGRLLALASASNLMYHFPVLFAMLAIASNRPELWGETLDRRLYHSLLIDPEVVSRVLHVWLAAVATAGAAVMVLAARLVNDRVASEGVADDNQRIAGSQLAAAGARWALLASLAQVPVGLWVLFELPGTVGAALWNGDVAVLLMLGAAVVLAMLLLQQLASVALGDTDPKSIRRSAATLAVVVLLMCGAVDRLQRLSMLPAAVAAQQRAQ